MKKMLLALTLTLTTIPAFAFHSVTEILPDGKLLICKDYGQVKKGDMVEVFKNRSRDSKSDKEMVKTSEFKLPAVGEKIKLAHKDFHPTKVFNNHHKEELGTATISGASLEGQERLVITTEKNSAAKRIETLVKIDNKEAEKIKNECLVAIPDNGLKVREHLAVTW